MSRVGFIYKIKPELKDEYKKVHDEIWPEQVKAMRDCGLRNFSIYAKKDGTLFAYLETENFDEAMEKLRKISVNIRWQNYMEKYFIKSKSNIIGPEIEILEEVWHQD